MDFFGSSPASGSRHRQHRSSQSRDPFSFPVGGGSSSTSAYRRRPREGYIKRLVARIRKYIRDLWRYARKNPLKVLLPLLTLLVSTGGLAALARRFGFRLPVALEEALGGVLGMSGAKQRHSGRGGHGGFGAEAEGFMGGMNAGGLLSTGLKVASAFI